MSTEPHVFVTDLSLHVLQVLWRRSQLQQYVTTGEVREDLIAAGRKTAIQTVLTTLTRLHRKGFVSKEQIPHYTRNQYRWKPLYSAHDMKRLVMMFARIYFRDEQDIVKYWRETRTELTS